MKLSETSIDECILVIHLYTSIVHKIESFTKCKKQKRMAKIKFHNFGEFSRCCAWRVLTQCSTQTLYRRHLMRINYYYIIAQISLSLAKDKFWLNRNLIAPLSTSFVTVYIKFSAKIIIIVLGQNKREKKEANVRMTTVLWFVISICKQATAVVHRNFTFEQNCFERKQQLRDMQDFLVCFFISIQRYDNNLPMMVGCRGICVSDGGNIDSSDVLCRWTSIVFIAFNSKLECRILLLLLLLLLCESSISLRLLIFADENSLINCYFSVCVEMFSLWISVWVGVSLTRGMAAIAAVDAI